MPRSPPDPQLGLFPESDRDPESASHPVLPAMADGHLHDLAARLPAGIHLGTSSWHFPGWATLVYDRPAEERVLAHAGLTAYARHPLLRCVGIDRTFYAPLPAAELRQYAEQVPPGFRFVVKAPMLCTAPATRGEPGAHAIPNPRFLDAVFATDLFVAPCLQGLGDRLGVLVFQFPPLGRAVTREPDRFAERLGAFLLGLPVGPCYAVELRDHALLGAAYFSALARAHAHHCLGLHPRMPVASEQARETGLDHAGPLIVRWNLHTGLEYEQARTRYAPFNRLVDEDIPNRVSLARLCLAASTRGDPVFVIANNKAEGCAPLTLIRLAEQIVAHAPGVR